MRWYKYAASAPPLLVESGADRVSEYRAMRAHRKEHEEKDGHHRRAHGGTIPAEVGDMKDRGHQEVKVTRARGGRAESKAEEKEEEKQYAKRKRGGHVKGDEPKHHLGKRARGGRMTPSSPLSGADAPNLPYAKGAAHSGARGSD